jgi:uncharacterized protein YecT (DUF1311 family)
LSVEGSQNDIYPWSIAAASALLLATSTALLAASETDMSKQYTTCMDKANGVNPDMIDCILAETKQQDARLNENYKRLMSKLSEERNKALLEAQRAWIRFRDANCTFWDDPAGGQSAAVTAKECILTMTADRASELELADDQ